MFELCRLCCEHAELHAPSSFGLDEFMIRALTVLLEYFSVGNTLIVRSTVLLWFLVLFKL